MTEPAQSPPSRAAAIIRRFSETLQTTESMPPAGLPDLQRRLLEPLLRHARAHVPFYRDSGRLDPLFRSDGSVDWTRWSEIPLLRRRDVQKAGDALHAERLAPEHGGLWSLSTSGSTGEPVRVVHSHLAGETVWTSVMLRALRWHGLDPTQRFIRVGSFSRTESVLVEPRPLTGWYPPFPALGLSGERLDIPELLPREEIIDAIASFRPACLSINPVELELLVLGDERRRLRDAGEVTVMNSADRMSEATKQLVRDKYGWRVLDIYASNECGLMAASCPHCHQFHVNAETIVVETLNEDGGNAASGSLGWVVATPLYNYAMPLIRYDHADQAVVGPEAAEACPITLPRLSSVIGKEPVVFEFRGGAKVRAVLPPSQIIKLLGASAFQVAQVSDDRCEFRIVPGILAPEDMRFDDMTRLMRLRWWPELNVSYRIVERLPGAGSRQKNLFFVREITDQNR